MIATYNTPEAQVYLIQRGYVKHVLENGGRYLVATIDGYKNKIYPKMYVVFSSNNVHSFKTFKVKLREYEKRTLKTFKIHHEWNLL